MAAPRGQTMELVQLRELVPDRWQAYEFDQWTHRLHSICGRYQSRLPAQSRNVTGAAEVMLAGGIEVARIANDLDVVVRDERDIRCDYGANLFLLLQLEGSCGVEQYGRQSIIEPGDCILVDSSSPSIFHFGGRFCNHLSVHLPRQLLFSEKSQPFEVSRRLCAADPMAAMLQALVVKLLRTDGNDKRAPHLRELLFSATRQAFATDVEFDRLPASDSACGRLEIVQVLIDRHLTEQHLTPQWLATKLGISLRTLQDDFSALGTTATSLIRLRRLHLAREQLTQMKRTTGASTIAEVAYSSGFNDISYFNRCFKRAFDCSPGDVLQREPGAQDAQQSSSRRA
jgi:AraC-like DNA-binding protein